MDVDMNHMMITFKDIKNKPNLFKCFTGLTVSEFSNLLPSFGRSYENILTESDKKRKEPRQRKRGGGSKPVLLTLEDKLLFILFYFKFYPVQAVQGYFFGIGQSQACDWIHRLSSTLNNALGYEKQLPARKTKEVKQVLEACPGLEFIIDGTERPIQRPKDKDRRKEYYSGKKKRHTVKNVVITDKRTKKIKALSDTTEGKKHDKTATDDWEVEFPPDSALFKDTGFQGYEPPNTVPIQPKKKPKGKELTPEEKQRNKEISRERVGVEHSIGGAKIYHIVRDTFRNHKNQFDDRVMEIACGLFNFKIDQRLKTA